MPVPSEQEGCANRASIESIVGLLEHRDVGAFGNDRRNMHAAIIHRLGADGSGWKQTTDRAPLAVDGGLDRVKSVAAAHTTATLSADIVGDDHRAVHMAHHTRSRWQRHQDLAHDHSLNDEQRTPPFRLWSD